MTLLADSGRDRFVVVGIDGEIRPGRRVALTTSTHVVFTGRFVIGRVDEDGSLRFSHIVIPEYMARMARGELWRAYTPAAGGASVLTGPSIDRGATLTFELPPDLPAGPSVICLERAGTPTACGSFDVEPA